MEGSAYIAMTGMQAAAQRMDVVSNNLSNAGTTGYKREQVAFRALPFFYQGQPNRVDVMSQGNGWDMSMGPLQQTGIPTNVAINGSGFFVVQSKGGAQAYTRDGNFTASSDGMLVNQNGQAVLGVGGAPLFVPAGATVAVGSDGTVSVTPNTPNAQAVSVGQILVVDPPASSVTESGANQFQPTAGGPLDTTPSAATLVSGALEGSNVNPVSSMVNMISASRLFQWETQAEQTISADDKSAQNIASNL
ncbi:flagellar basal-body rod protein FlgF [Acidithiobacillus ferrivorans]|nr:flagellar basal-body rod protein FlgF [Acidithiobacillus ferrivorans]